MDALFKTENLDYNGIIDYPDIVIEKGKVNFIVGESGCGKSTLLKLFNASLSPSKGSVFYNGKDIKDIDTLNLRKEVSLVSQEVFLFDETIEENFRQFYSYRELPTPSESDIRKMLDICCIDFPLDKDCTNMSGGERQRVYTAIFLSFMPKVLMLDEPTSALDEKNSVSVIANIIKYCAENKIELIIVTHDPSIREQENANVIKLERRNM